MLAAQQILAELLEGVLSRLVLSHVSHTQRSIHAESTSCLQGQLCGATSQKCVELCGAVLSAAVCIFYSPAAPPIEPDSSSELIVFSTALRCKSCQRYGILREIQLQAAL